MVLLKNILAGIVGNLKIWEEDINKKETHIFVAIRISCGDDKTVEREVEKTKK